MIVVRELAGAKWYVLSRRYPDELSARAAWRRIDDEGTRRREKLDVGVYRHGEPENPTLVSAVTLSHANALVVERLLENDGGEWSALDELWADAMIIRRARVVSDLLAANAPSGRYAIKRGRRGARLHPDGTMDERGGVG